MNNEEKILKILESMQSQINGLQSQSSEDTQILKSLEHNSQVHKAEIDKLNHHVAELQGTMKNICDKMDENFSELKETNKSLLEMYGSHEAEIRTLRRKPV